MCFAIVQLVIEVIKSYVKQWSERLAIQKDQNQPLKAAFRNSRIEFLAEGVQKVVVRIDESS